MECEMVVESPGLYTKMYKNACSLNSMGALVSGKSRIALAFVCGNHAWTTLAFAHTHKTTLKIMPTVH